MAQGSLFAGTSGYAYKEWCGSFYPDDAGAGDFLPHYASRLSTVEINNTFYRFPSEKVLEEWASATPDGFCFAVKANMRITHKLRLKNARDVTASFVERCGRLGAKLGPILFQLTPQAVRNDARLTTFLGELPPDQRYAMEFRHQSWLDDAVYEALAAANVALVVADGDKHATPRLRTADFVYVRLRGHGYDEASLTSWREWIDTQRCDGHDVYAYLKHDDAGTSPATILAALETA